MWPRTSCARIAASLFQLRSCSGAADDDCTVAVQSCVGYSLLLLPPTPSRSRGRGVEGEAVVTIDPLLYEPAVRGTEGRGDVRARARARAYLGVPRVCGRGRCARARVYGQDVGCKSKILQQPGVGPGCRQLYGLSRDAGIASDKSNGRISCGEGRPNSAS